MVHGVLALENTGNYNNDSWYIGSCRKKKLMVLLISFE
jgi:hypothetical protein